MATRALMSDYAILQRSAQSYSKLGCLWFDEMVFHVPREEHLRNWVSHVTDTEHLSASEQDELRRMWVPLQRALPGYNYYQKELGSEQFIPLGPLDRRVYFHDRLYAIARRVLADDAEKKQGPSLAESLRQARAGSLRHVAEPFAAWTALNFRSDCAFLPVGAVETAIASQMFTPSNEEEKDFDAFGCILSREQGDFADIPWRRIIELRHHSYIESFRDKVRNLMSGLVTFNAKQVLEAADEIERRDLQEIARLARPTARKTLLKAIIGSIPFPTPLPNPLGLGFNVADAVDARKREKRFGWLYFLLDFRDNA